ncbi:hypothetical protein LINGRAHAP2_LOCUS15957 [Linum grandiflorum]
MARKQSNVARRAWNILRLALLWARKGGVFKRRLMVDLRLVPKFIKSLAHNSSSSAPRGQIGFYGERELSFDKTPLFQVKMHRPASMRFIIPCITPQQVDFDYDFDEFCNREYGEQEEEQPSTSSSFSERGTEEDEEVEEGSEGIDSKAEKFIAQFYEQMKLQRQISYLEYKK